MRRAGIAGDQKSTDGPKIHAPSVVPSSLQAERTKLVLLPVLDPVPRAGLESLAILVPPGVYCPCRSHPDTHPFRLR